MKTADSIEQQEARKQARDNGNSSPASTPPASKKSGRGDANRIAPWRWKPGQSGNPTGARHDLAREVARAVFENNMEALYKAYSKAALKGNAYAFKELADRAFGKLRETIHAEISPFDGQTDEDLEAKVRELEEKLGYRSPEPKVLPPADAPKPN